ncbi:mannonate dehydratase [Candidatus Latescibacterota bacterium]
MKRRDFGKVAVSSAFASGISTNTFSAAQQSKPFMYSGNHQRFGINDKDLQYLQRFGVKYKIATPTFSPETGWNLEEILRMKEKCMEYDIVLEGLVLPYRQINNPHVPNFMLGNYDKADKEIDIFCNCIRIASQAGIRVLLLSLKEMENQRTESTLGRGGSRLSTWDLNKAKNRNQMYDTILTAEENWNRITYFLERFIPVATEYKVQIANHPCDPWLPPGHRGVDRVLGGFGGFKKYIEICPSPYHGLLLCTGCMASACDNPETEIYDIVKYFGKRKKIFYIHFRNIIGGRNKFQEVYPDEGVMDMFKIVRILRDVGYPYTLDPDHYPGHTDDPGGYQAGAYQYGYINAMIQTVYNEK